MVHKFLRKFSNINSYLEGGKNSRRLLRSMSSAMRATRYGVLFYVLGVLPVFAQIKVTASVSETTVSTDDMLIYTVEIKASGQLPNLTYTPTAPQAQGLSLAQDTPNVSQGSVYANGRSEQTASFSWYYRPLKAGEGYIGRTTVVVGKETYTTMPISVRVIDQGSKKPQQPQFRSKSLFDDPFDQGSPNAPSAPPQPKPQVGDKDVFIRAFPNSNSVYQGDQVYITYFLYIPNDIRIDNARLADSWDAPGFWKEELPDEQLTSNEVINGKSYRKVLAKRVVVFPAQSGALKVDPLKIQGDASRTNLDDPFDAIFGSGAAAATVPITIESPTVAITSKPLPSGAPRAFSGAVGSYRMDSMLDKHDVEAGTPVTLTVVITGIGNISTITPPVVEVPSSIEKYDPEVTNEVVRESTILGTKTFKFTLIPRTNGKQVIPPIEFSYFDPAKGTYQTVRSESYTLNVTGNSQPINTERKGKFPANDIAGLMAGAVSWQKASFSQPLRQNPLVWVALILPLLALGGLFMYRKQTDRIETDVEYARRRQADSVAKKHLKTASRLLEQQQPKSFYEEISRAILGFIGNRLNVAEQGLTSQQLDETLAERGVSDSIRSSLMALLRTCDEVRFSPIQPTPETMRQSYQQGETLLNELDKVLPKK